MFWVVHNSLIFNCECHSQVAALSEEREILLVKQHEQESVVLELQHKLRVYFHCNNSSNNSW